MSSKYFSNVQPKKLMGTLANRPAGADLQDLAFGTQYTAQETGALFEVTGVPTSTRAWDQIGGASSLPKYFVSPPGIAPFAEFTTIQSAIAQAVTDGHTSNTNPCVILIEPGNYAENLVLHDGIHLVALGGEGAQDLVAGVSVDWNEGVRVTGNVTLDAAFANGSVVGIRFLSTSGSTFDMGASATLASISLHACALRTISATLATFASAATASPVINFDRCNLHNAATNPNTSVLSLTTSCTLNSLGTSYLANAGGDKAISVAGGTHRFEQSPIFGQFVQAASSIDSFVDCDMAVVAVTALTTIAGGTITWKRGGIGGATAGALFTGAGTVTFADDFALSKYWVAPPNFFPFAPYTTIQSAINAAVADGHNAANPTSVRALSGTYTENIVLKDGIDVIGQGGYATGDLNLPGGNSWNPNVIISGGITLDPGVTVCNLIGLRVSATATAALAIAANASLTNLTMHFCSFLTTAALPVVTGAPTLTPTINFDSCQLRSGNVLGGVSVVSFTTPVNGHAGYSSFRAGADTDTSLGWTGGIHRFKSCEIRGNISYLAQSTQDTYQDCDMSLTTNSAVTFGATASTVTWTNGSIIGAVAGTTFSGTGTINLINARVDANAVTVPSTVTCTTSGILRAFIVSAIGAADKTVTNVDADLYTFNTQAATRTLNLPAANTVPIGTAIAVGMGAGTGANAITVHPNGTNTINGTNADLLTSATLHGGMTLRSVSNAGWVTTAWS